MDPNKEKYFTLFNEVSDSIVIMDDGGHLTDVNGSLCKLLGYTRQELLNMTIEGLIDRGQLQTDPIAYEPIMSGKHIIRERRLQKKDGSIIEMEINIKRVSENMIVGIGRDITELRTAQKINALSESKLRSAFENSAMGMLLVSTKGKFLQANKKFAQITGYSDEELLQMTPYDITHPDDIEKSLFLIDDALQGKFSTFSIEKRYIHKNKNLIWVNITSSAVIDTLGHVQYFVAQVEDITEKKESEAGINKINHDMGKRVKELNCLYRVSELTNDPGKTIEDILQELVQIIPAAYRSPEITTARITLKGRVFESKNFSDSIWKQDVPIKINNKNAGSVEVFYTREMPEEDEGPFLKEERSLINSIAEMLGSAADRKNAESALKEQAEIFQAIIENTKESIFLISPDCKIMQFNKIALERLRITSGMDIYIGADFRQFLYPETADIFNSMFEDVLNGKYLKEETKIQGVVGDYFWIQSKMSPVYHQNGELIGVTLLAEDIDDRKRAEAELRESEEKFRSIVEHSLVGIYILQNEKLVYVNPGFEKIFGYSKNELLNNMTFDRIIHEDDLKLVIGSYNSRISNKKTKTQYNFRAFRNDGVLLHVEVIATMISYNDEPAVIGTLIDITGRIEEERRINQAIVDAQERERLQISMELHDNVKQILAGSGLFLSSAKKNLDNKEVLASILDDLKKYNTEAIDEIRRLSHRLTPGAEMNSNLDEKITRLIKSLKIDETLSVSFHIDEFEKPLDNNIQLSFYRILQEQLNNILKYAKASTVEINIRSVGQVILLQVRDNGKGFDIDSKKEGIGLENIRRRAELMNGKVEIISSPGNGCEVKVQVPVTSVTQHTRNKSLSVM